MAVEAPTPSAPSTPQTRRAGRPPVRFGTSLPRIQAIVGTVAGLISIAGAVSSLAPFVRSANTGQLVATVQDAVSHRSVSDATIEILTAQNEVVATMSPDSSGHATRSLGQGVYIVRVSHPRYASDMRRVQVVPRQTVEIRASLRAGSSSPVQRAIDHGVGAVRRALRF
jgi:carboxypeptidase family protein